MDRLEAIKKLDNYCRKADCYSCPIGDSETGECTHKKPFCEYTDTELKESLEAIEEAEYTDE